MKKGILSVMVAVCLFCFLPMQVVSAADVIFCPVINEKTLYTLSTFPTDSLLLSLVGFVYPTVKSGTGLKAMGKTTNTATGLYTWHSYSIDSAGTFDHYWVDLTMTKNTNSLTLRNFPYFWMYTVYIPITTDGVTTMNTCTGLLAKVNY
jgi:hypothetical protein